MRQGIAAVADRGFALFGVVFSLQWAAAVLAFPAYKQRPSGYVPVVAGVLLGVLACSAPIRTALTRCLLRIHPARFLAGVVLGALAVRLIAILTFPCDPLNDHLFYHRYACNLVGGQGYGGLPWPAFPHLGSQVWAFYPPGMSLSLAGWYGLTGATPVWGKLMNALFGTALVVLLYDIGRRAVGEAVGRWAAVLGAVMPSLVLYGASLGYEIVLGTVFCAIVDLALIVATPGKRSWPAVAAIGLLLGYGSLVKPICLPIPVLLLAWWLVMGLGRRALLCTGVAGVLMAAVILPWTLRNYCVLGKFVLISTNGGYAFYNANNPQATGLHVYLDPLPGETDEVQMDQLRRRAGWEFVRRHPDQVLRLALIKTTLTWGTDSTIMSFLSGDRMSAAAEMACMMALNTAWTALVVVCFWAMAATAVWKERRLYLAFGLLAYVFAIHLVFEAESRHHIPVMGALLLVAACGMARNGREQPSGLPRELRERRNDDQVASPKVIPGAAPNRYPVEASSDPSRT